MTQPEVTTSLGTEMNPLEVKERGNRKKEGKVFPHLVDKAAFVDTIRLSVYSDQKPRVDGIADQKNVGILSLRSNYARRITGISTATGNEITILYGKVNRFSAVPPVSMTVRSESIPVTAAQINKMVESVFPGVRDVRVSSVELTFDVSTFSYAEACRSAVYRAIHTKEWGNARGRRTFYIGSPRSPWFARIYEKKERVLRVEFELRRGFLSAQEWNHPNDLIAMRTLRLSKLVSLRMFTRSGIMAATEGWPETAVEWCLQSTMRPLWHVNRILCAASRTDANRLLPQSMHQRQLESMQRLLVW
jgi:hypothetical protein